MNVLSSASTGEAAALHPEVCRLLPKGRRKAERSDEGEWWAEDFAVTKLQNNLHFSKFRMAETGENPPRNRP